MKIFNLTIFYGMMLIKKYWVDSNLWPVAMLQIIFVEKKNIFVERQVLVCSLVWWKPTFQLLFVSFIIKPLKLSRTIKELSWGSPLSKVM